MATLFGPLHDACGGERTALQSNEYQNDHVTTPASLLNERKLRPCRIGENGFHAERDAAIEKVRADGFSGARCFVGYVLWRARKERTGDGVRVDDADAERVEERLDEGRLAGAIWPCHHNE